MSHKSVLGPLGLLLVGFLALTGCKTTSSAHGPVYLIKIEKGDTLARIATKYDTTWKQIVRLNDLDSPGHLEVGQIIRVAPGPAGLIAAKKGPMTHFDKGEQQAGEKKGLLFTPPNPKARPNGSKRGGGLLFGDTASSGIVWPVQGTLTSKYGRRWGRFHHGIDISAKRGTQFNAALGGEVKFVGWKKGYGKTIVIQHDGINTLYAHCSRILVSRGQWVDKGQTIGRVGTTGNARGAHLHFEVRKGKQSVDPLKYLDRDMLISSL